MDKQKQYYWLLQKKRRNCSLAGGSWSTIYSDIVKSKVNNKYKNIPLEERDKYRIFPLYRGEN